MSEINQSVVRTQESILRSNAVLKNTYLLLSLAFVISAAAAWLSVKLNVGPMMGIGFFVGAIVMLWFVVPRFAESSGVGGLISVFIFTALLGAALGPTLNHYLTGFANGSKLITTALGGTAVIFFALSGYVLTSKKDFSFLGGFLFVGMIVLFGAVILSLFFNYSALQLAISAGFILISSGFILFDTSRIINGGEDNYIIATVSIFVSLFNIFTSLLHILGAFAGEK